MKWEFSNERSDWKAKAGKKSCLIQMTPLGKFLLTIEGSNGYECFNLTCETFAEAKVVAKCECQSNQQFEKEFENA